MAEKRNNLTREIQLLGEKVDSLATIVDTHQKKMEPVYLWFQNVNFFKRSLMWILGLISALGGLALMFKQLFK